MRETIVGDSIELMSEMADNEIDIMLTSPPFKEEDVEGDYWEFYDEFYKQSRRICSKVLIIIHSATKINRIMQDYPPDRVMVWAKGHSLYSWRWNPIYVYQLDPEYNINKRMWSDCFNSQAVTGSGKKHKYEDPLNLYRMVLKMFSDCNSVIDPFVGSGTTALAAKQIGMDFKVIDISKSNIQTTKKRLEQEVIVCDSSHN